MPVGEFLYPGLVIIAWKLTCTDSNNCFGSVFTYLFMDDLFSCPTPAPLVSLIIVTCNRHAFLRLALRAAAAQTYSAIEVIVVDDGPKPAAASAQVLGHGYRFPVRLLRLSSRRSIGAKRNAGVHAARGEVLVHWDDDDVHDPKQLATLACPILNHVADVTALTFSYLARLSTSDMQFYAYRPPSRTRKRIDTGPFLGSLAYSRAVVSGLLAHGGGGGAPFANTSLSEDLDFVERALDQCRRMLPLAWRAHVVYTRHVAVSNTWRPASLETRMRRAGAAAAPTDTAPPTGTGTAPAAAGDRVGSAVLGIDTPIEPPAFVSAELRAADCL